VLPSDVDIYCLATMTEKLEVVTNHIQKLDSFSKRVQNLEAAQREDVMGSATMSAVADFPPLSAAPTSSTRSSTLVSDVTNGVGNSSRGLWADLVDKLGADDFSLVINKKCKISEEVIYRKSSKSETRMVKGKSVNEGKFMSSQSHGRVFVS